ncbi:MAG: hypothetical protein CMN78_03310 [Spirochaetales bacterium]|nr:hypothetical protein [Spirochaetales bacterium]
MKKLKWIRHEDLAIKKTPSVGREEYLDFMTFKENRRPLFTEIFGPIVGLKEEWEAQGATPAELDFSAFQFRFESRGGVPISTGRAIKHGPVVIEETEEHIITRDDIGRVMKLSKGTATIPLPLNFPVSSMDDWLKIKPLYQFHNGRFGKDWQAIAEKHLSEDRVVSVSIPGGYDEPRELMGEVELSYAYYENQELVHDILKTICTTAFTVLDAVSAAVQVDLLSVHEDMAGKSGPLAGPKQIREFILPYYKKIWDMLKSRGARLFDQDSDGDMNSVIPVFLDAGVNVMHPMEPAANMDLVKTRETYGDALAFYGGIDKHVIRKSRNEIITELEYKIPPMVQSGGCVLALDHRIPNGTPLDNYRFYLSKAWEIINREAKSLE